MFHVVKGLLKSYTIVQKQSTSVTEVGMAHIYQSFIKNLAKFQVSVQINEDQQKVNELEVTKTFKKK